MAEPFPIFASFSEEARRQCLALFSLPAPDQKPGSAAGRELTVVHDGTEHRVRMCPIGYCLLMDGLVSPAHYERVRNDASANDDDRLVTHFGFTNDNFDGWESIDWGYEDWKWGGIDGFPWPYLVPITLTGQPDEEIEAEVRAFTAQWDRMIDEYYPDEPFLYDDAACEIVYQTRLDYLRAALGLSE